MKKIGKRDPEIVADQGVEAFRVLVVDDEPSIIRVFKKVLEDATPRRSSPLPAKLFEVDSCTSGAQAIEAVEAGLAENRPFSMAFVDCVLSEELTGPEVVREFWKTDPHIQICLITGHNDFSWHQALRPLEGINSDGINRFMVLKKPAHNIEILQVANILTQYWELCRGFKNKQNYLESLVQERTTELRREMEEHKREVEARQKSDELFRRIAESARELILMTNCDGRVVYANPFICQCLGFTKEQIIDSSPLEMVCAEDRQKLHRAMTEAMVTGVSQTLEHGIEDGSGSQRILETRIAKVESSPHETDCLLMIAREITGRVAAESVLRQSETFLRALVELLPVEIYHKDLEGRYTFVNDNFCSMVGRTRESLLGKKDVSLFPPAHAKQDQEDDYQVIHEKKPLRAIREIISPSGKLMITDTIKSPIFDEGGRCLGVQVIFWDITAKMQAQEELKRSKEHLSCALAELHSQKAALDSHAIVCITDVDGQLVYVNDKYCHISLYSRKYLIGQNPRILSSGKHDENFWNRFWKTIRAGKVWHGEIENKRKDGSAFWVEATVTPFQNQHGEITQYVGIMTDITSLKLAEAKTRETEVQLRHAQKMESIGQLAAGIAHEINTPTQFVSDNLNFLGDALRDIRHLLHAVRESAKELRGSGLEHPKLTELDKSFETVDLEFLLEEIPQSIEQATDGVQRISRIVRAMKNFSHPCQTVAMEQADINQAIETTVTVARNEWKYVSQVVLNLEKDLPKVSCYLGELNQVFLNLIVNAAQAIGETEAAKAGTKGEICITTQKSGSGVEIRIRDNGTGIPEGVQQKIFDPFFTTKAVGKGTGQGLFIAHNVVVEQHHGSLNFKSEVGKGTEFILTLPIDHKSKEMHEGDGRKKADSLC